MKSVLIVILGFATWLFVRLYLSLSIWEEVALVICCALLVTLPLAIADRCKNIELTDQHFFCCY